MLSKACHQVREGGWARRMPTAILPFLARLAREDEGVVMPFVAVGMIGLIAVGALIADAGRLFNLHTQEQSYADHVALAAAAELDGRPGAITRAIGAASLLTDTQNFATGDAALSASLSFLSKLGAGWGPAGSVAGDVTTTDDTQARFVQVMVQPRQLQFVFASVLQAMGLGSVNQANVSTFAIAGFTRVVCDIPPLMICNPAEYLQGQGAAYTPVPGRQIRLKFQGESASWEAGDFGLLAAPPAPASKCDQGNPNSAASIRCVLAALHPNTQCTGRKVKVAPGAKEAVNTGLNVRFDIFDKNNQEKDPDFPAAMNVTKGKVHAKDKCTSRKSDLSDAPRNADGTPSPETTESLPRDLEWSGPEGRFGNGITTAQLLSYWAINHSNDGAPFPAGKATRYEIYRSEIDSGKIPDKSPGGKSSDPENGTPTCATLSVDDPNRDRRVLIVAVINCVDHESDMNGPKEVPVEAYSKMFLTEPITLKNPDDPENTTDPREILVEELGTVQPGELNGILHDFPVLYR